MDQKENIRVGIIGGAGYTGGELIRVLLNHPNTEISFIHSRSNAGNPVSKIHPDLLHDTDLKFTSDISQNVDVIFLCVGHGEASKFLETHSFDENIKLIDLSQDYRIRSEDRKENFVYGLPELNKERIKKANKIANPGCFATAIQLGLLPLAEPGLLGEANVTGITGSTGAGQGLSSSSHFSWRANNIQPYKTLSHQHLKEINQSLLQLGGKDIPIHFIPWRGDFTRGIFISTMIHCDQELNEIEEIYKAFYKDHPFTTVSEEPIFLKQVVNTNHCFINLEKVGTKLVIHSAIDNLLKGASGQAVQNMNLMFGLDEKAGLKLKANLF